MIKLSAIRLAWNVFASIELPGKRLLVGRLMVGRMVGR